ncbi:MAG: hypothetical protein IIU75_04870 [Rikenellaceae bacterium]|nr:hypothetical protein [Rikenellaceae bacterium]
MRIDESQLKRIGEQFGEFLAERFNQSLSHTVTVMKVDDDYAEVEEFDGDAPIRVPLMCLNAGSAVLKVKPKQYSTAIILYTEGDVNRPVFVGFTEVEEITVVVGESSVKITDGLIEFNGGENKGMVLAESVKDKLNKIEDDINALKSAMSSWTPVPNDGGASLKAATSTWFAQRLVSTQLSDIENDKITQ